MRYKSAETILVQIAGDEQASAGVRLGAIKIVANAGKLPQFKGYKSGSPENLLLRLAYDSKTPAKDRLTAVRKLLGQKKLAIVERAGSQAEPSDPRSHEALQAGENG